MAPGAAQERPRGSSVELLFLPGARGEIAVAHWYPRTPVAPRGSLLVVPPFAEEMNKCRRMVAETAMRLAGAGFDVFAPDFHGTGDSAGEFRDARLASWLDDLDSVASHAGSVGRPLTALLAVRLGVPIALSWAGISRGIGQIALWQPVSAGAQFLGQFLRLRVAGGLLGGSGAETIASLQAELKAGRTLEVAGYELTPQLAEELGSLDLRALVPPSTAVTHWFEVSAAESPVLSRAGADRLESWKAAALDVTGTARRGDSFWSATEITLCPSLIDDTFRWLAPDR